MSAPCVSAVGQSTGSALHSLDFTAVPLWGWMCGCEQWVAPALFSIFLHNCRNFKKVVTKVWIFSSSIINFFFLFFSSSITLVFFPGSALIPWQLSASSEGCSSAFTDVPQHKGKCCFSKVLHEAWRRDLRACASSALPPRFLYGAETHLAQRLHKCLHIKSDPLADLSSCPWLNSVFHCAP